MGRIFSITLPGVVLPLASGFSLLSQKVTLPPARMIGVRPN